MIAALVVAAWLLCGLAAFNLLARIWLREDLTPDHGDYFFFGVISLAGPFALVSVSGIWLLVWCSHLPPSQHKNPLRHLVIGRKTKEKL